MGWRDLFRPAEAHHSHRVVFVNDPEKNTHFAGNKVSNVKYEYPLITFIPKNFFEQFSRFINRYFLLIATLQLFPELTPVEPMTTWLPLTCIFLLSAAKEGFDDYHRAKQDKLANEKIITVARDGKRVDIMSQDIHVGDIVYLKDDSEVPADLVLLSTSDPNGACYITTANLDGETDLKNRQALEQTASFSEKEMLSFNGVIECAAPNPDIYIFNSRLKMTPEDTNWLPLSLEQNLLQGTSVRHTDWIYGAVVYAGKETKIGKNKKTPPTKWTAADRYINRVSVVLFTLQLCLTLALGVVGDVWKDNQGRGTSYLLYPSIADEDWWQYLVIPVRFLLLMSYMIPISLKVTLDITKYLYSMFINWDLEMYCAESDWPANATNTAIAEDLGQIEYVFTDKTGTLTENIMSFKKCSISGEIYGHNIREPDALRDPSLVDHINRDDDNVMRFIRALALCHTVVPTTRDEATGLMKLKSSSPDEEALVRAAGDLKVEFVQRDGDDMKLLMHRRPRGWSSNTDNSGSDEPVPANGDASMELHDMSGPNSPTSLRVDKPDIAGEEEYTVLNVMEFSSDRKRMSVLLRSKVDKKLWLVTKGADDVIFERLQSDQDQVKSSTALHLEAFAAEGLRTLVIAGRELTEEDVKTYFAAFDQAKVAMDDRDAKIAKCYELLEHSLVCYGATAIEDKLQDQVPETIALLRRAGVTFWMLTGDKFSTALQIATACNLMSPEPEGQLLHITGETVSEIGDSIELLSQVASKIHTSKNITVVIEGVVLNVALEHFPQPLLELTLMSKAVVCCRVTPKQKAGVVALVKENGNRCLSIGDGGNDVAMIQEAHVGVGLAGREGLQAARAADFTLGRFKFLARLLLVHGRQCYRRTSFVGQYCFYKSIIVALMQMSYCFYSGYAGTTFFNSFSLALYNVFFTGLSPFFYPLDRDVSDSDILQHPYLYRDGQQGRFLNRSTVSWWFLRAVFHACTVFYVTFAVFNDGYMHPTDGSPMDYDSINMIAFSALLTVQVLVYAFETNTFSVLTSTIIFGSYAIYWLMVSVYTLLPGFDFYFVMIRLFLSPAYWLTIVVSTAICVVPVIATKFGLFNYYPTPAQEVRMFVRSKGQMRPIRLQSGEGTDPSQQPLSYTEAGAGVTQPMAHNPPSLRSRPTPT